MLYPHVLKRWVWAGIHESSLHDVSPIKLSNIIALTSIIALLLQLPKIYLHWHSEAFPLLACTLFHCMVFTWVPILNHFKQFYFATTLLSLTFLSFIIASCSLWTNDIYIQHFLLLGVFICPFVFEQSARKTCYGFIALYATSFVFIQYYFQFIPPIADNHSLKFSNCVVLALACALNALYIHSNLSCGWNKQYKQRLIHENMLSKTLPKSIAKRLAQKPGLIADLYPQATLIFIDIVDFTPSTQTLAPNTLVSFLNHIYSQFDNICRHHKVEKIKTMGDAYMAVCGAPDPALDHAPRGCLIALEIIAWIEQHTHSFPIDLKVRIGICSGEVIAGVIGQDKYCFDVWGETVNLASRLQSTGKSNQIHVSSSTYELSKSHFNFKPRGTIEMKGVGAEQTYWLMEEKTFDGHTQ